MKILSLIFTAAAAMLAGCATNPLDGPADGHIDITHFQAVTFASVRITDGAQRGLHDDERVALERELRAALEDGTPPSLLSADRSAAVVRIEVTVTELNASSPTVNLLTTALLFVPFDAGGVAFEARFYDGESTEPFARTTHRHTSTPLELKGSFRRYGHASRAMHDWAEEITAGIGSARAALAVTR